jgi:hypothetical protein
LLQRRSSTDGNGGRRTSRRHGRTSWRDATVPGAWLQHDSGSGWAAGARQRVGGAPRPKVVREAPWPATGRGGPRDAMAAPRGNARRLPAHGWGNTTGVVGVRRRVVGALRPELVWPASFAPSRPLHCLHGEDRVRKMSGEEMPCSWVPGESRAEGGGSHDAEHRTMLDLEVALLTAPRESNHFPAIIHMGLNQYMYIYVIYRKPLIHWRYTGKWPIHL